ncbi:MAG: LegC family aminotransferase [Alphaproteobacteria bacterium]
MEQPLAQNILARLQKLLPLHAGPYPLHEPSIGGNAWDYVKDCLDSGWVSSVGTYVDRFEQQLVAFTGAKAALATVNGTAALHTCLLLAGVKSGDEVLAPSLTFVATANAIAYCGAEPHFVEVEETSLGVDANRLGTYLHDIAELRDGVCFNKQSGRPIRALIVMHCFGHLADLDPLAALARQHGIRLVEDAAESMGSLYRGRHTGLTGLAAVSFNGNKTITTGGGGAILFTDQAIADRARHLTTTARIGDGVGYEHDQVAYNYRLPNINAALGCAQLEQLPGFLAAKRRLAAEYLAAFADCEDAAILAEPPYARSNYWLNTLILAPEIAGSRPALLNELRAAGYLCRPLWTPMHMLDIYAHCPHMDLSLTQNLYRRTISLPSSPALRA